MWNSQTTEEITIHELKILTVDEGLKITCVILPNNVADDDRRRCGAIPAAPLAFSVRWSSNRSVEALDNQ